MFTPPPSPMPPLEKELDEFPLPKQGLEPHPSPLSQTPESKLATGRRTKWAVLLVPFALVFITASTRYATHPAAFDVLSGGPIMSWETLSTKSADWRLHRRHPEDDASASALTLSATSGAATATDLVGASASGSATSSETASTTAATAQALPTVPTNPDLPSPFPQAFDSDITQNYSSMTCFNFFSNMTNTAAFRSCRPFSILLQTSNAFIDTQNNLTELNAAVWGTCNPPLGYDQCTTNMAWFTSALPTACATDIADENALVLSTLTALRAYPVMYAAACQSDPTTNIYCYVNAVHATNPSDQYFYQLPLNVSVPQGSTPSCSACTKSVMNIYAEAYDGSDALEKTYPSAQKLADEACGDGYAPTVAVATSGSVHLLPSFSLMLVLACTISWIF